LVNNALIVKKIDEGGESEGKLKANDEITHIDGIPVQIRKIGQFVELIMARKGKKVLISFSRHMKEEDVSMNRPSTQIPPCSETFSIELSPGPLGLNVRRKAWDPPIGIEIGSITVPSQCSGKVNTGDWIVELNGTSLSDFSIDDFKELTQKQKDDPKTLLIKRWGGNQANKLQEHREALEDEYEGHLLRTREHNDLINPSTHDPLDKPHAS